MIVVDTNVIASLYLGGDEAGLAESWLRKERDWAVPVLWRSEFRNVLAAYLRRQQLTFDGVRQIQREAELLLLGNEHQVDSECVLERVRDSVCSAYDCELVALATRLGVKLLTADRKVLQAFPAQTLAF